MKNLIAVCFGGPVLFSGWCGLSYLTLGTVAPETLYKLGFFTVVCWGAGASLIRFHRKAVSERVYLDVKLNVIEVADGEHFTAPFSSNSRFLADVDQFEKVVRAAANRRTHMRDRFMASRQSAHVRLWTGDLGITQLEYEAIAGVLEGEFIDPEIDVVEGSVLGDAHQTAIRV